MATKTDLVRAIAKQCEITQDKANETVNAFLDYITQCVSEGESLNITGYFSISTVFKPEHEARNPQTGKVVKVPGKNRISMKAGKTLKDASNPASGTTSKKHSGASSAKHSSGK